MTKSKEVLMSHRYEFDKGLAVGEKLEILAMDPVFSAVAEALAPALGVTTKRSSTNAKGMLLCGAATVLFGSDRSAEAELRYQWSRLVPMLKRSGVEVSPDPPAASSWRYYREEYLTADIVAEMKQASVQMWGEQALKMGIFPAPQPGHNWVTPDHLHTAYADGTWFAPASRTNIRGQKSKAKNGAPRLSEGVNANSKLDGYCAVWLIARRPEKRMRTILDFEPALGGAEIPVAVNRLEALRERVGDGLRHFVYDRALSGRDDVTRIIEMGILPIGKPDGVHAFSDWRKLEGSQLGNRVMNFELDLSGCVHQLGTGQGMLWHLDDDGGGWRYSHPATVKTIRRFLRSDGTYGFKYGLRLKCGSSWHQFPVDPTGLLSVDGGTRQVQLAPHVKPHSVADHRTIAHAYSIRNDAESGFGLFKNHMGIGDRAGSYTALAHEIDLLLLATTANALTWAEWQQEYAD